MTQNKRRIGVVGAGYVGLTTGVCMAELGHQARILDIDRARIASLAAGSIPFYEKGMDEALARHLADGSISFSTAVEDVIPGSEFVYLCVPSPAADDGSVDLRAVEAASTSIGPHLDAGAVVINKSTVPVGSTRWVHELIGRDDISVASNPEFLREGTALEDFMNPDRIVIGAETDELAQRVGELYRSLDADFVYTDPSTAELIKYVCNAYLATRLSFINDVAELCEAVGGESTDVMRAMGLDKRIGPHFLQPGPGWGGSCFPKDTTALTAMAASAGHDFRLMQAVVDSNQRQFERMATRVQKILHNVGGTRVAVWGLAFKAGTDDIRSSPALEVVDRLLAAGVDVAAYDPKAHVQRAGLTQVDTALEAAADADVLVVLTEWAEFASIDPATVASTMRTPRVLDTRRVLDADAWTDAGFTCEAVGRSATQARTLAEAD